MPDTPLPPSAPDSASKRLEGWKEISAYFGRGVRTVQRWETALGMPVHRMAMVKGETVYALVEELEAWRREVESRAGAGRAASDGPAALDSSSEGGTAAEPEAAAASAGGQGPRAATPHRAGWIAAIAAVTVLAAAGWAASRAHWWPWARVSPVRAQVEGNALVAYDGAGKALWRYAEFPFRLTPGLYERQRRDGRDPIVVDDIDGDGRQEVLFAAEPEQAGGQSAFYCFNASGSVRFTHQPGARVAFGPLPCAPPYRLMWFTVYGDPGRAHRLWLVWSHAVEFPTVVEEMNPAGKVLGHYWSNGQVDVLAEATLGGRPVALVGAVSNETHGASLAVLDRRDPTATAPAENEHYRCAGCPPAAPLAFVVFPALDATMAIRSYAVPRRLTVDDDGRISAVLFHDTTAVVPEAESYEQSESLYVLDRDFRVVNAELGQGYGAIHRRFEAKGFLTHAFGSAADANLLWPVRRWNPGRNRFDLVTGPETGR